MGDMTGRIESLRREHSRIEEQVRTLEGRSSESPEIRDLKKRKLAIKDELAAATS